MQLFIMMQVLHIKLSGVGCCSDYTRKPDFNITLGTIFILRKDIQGQPLGFDTKYLALADRNMQVKFSLKVVWES